MKPEQLSESLKKSHFLSNYNKCHHCNSNDRCNTNLVKSATIKHVYKKYLIGHIINSSNGWCFGVRKLVQKPKETVVKHAGFSQVNGENFNLLIKLIYASKV